MIVRWGLGELPRLLEAVPVRRPLVVTSERWTARADALLPAARVFGGVRPHAGVEGVEGALAAASDGRSDGVVAIGGGSAIDTAKAVSARVELPLVSVPTTYSGSEWTSSYGMRDEARGVKAGGGGARPAGIVYDPELTLGLPRAESGGTALNALAHCAEALYVLGRTPGSDAEALVGARLIAEHLPRVLAHGSDLAARRGLLAGAMHAGAALARAGLGLGHAMAQTLGGAYGSPHGALNAVCLPPALRFNEGVAAEPLARLADAIGAVEAAEGVEELARLAGFVRLRDLSIPEDAPEAVAEHVVARPGARMNPREASTVDVTALLRSVY